MTKSVRFGRIFQECIKKKTLKWIRQQQIFYLLHFVFSRFERVATTIDSESDTDEEDDFGDSVSVAYEKLKAGRAPQRFASTTVTLNAQDNDSGRGESPESFNSKLSPSKPRPISGKQRPTSVVSEDSEISTTSSCKNSDEEAVGADCGVHVVQGRGSVITLNKSPEKTANQVTISTGGSSSTTAKDSPDEKVFNIFGELLKTEESYVSVLYLIDQVSFCPTLNKDSSKKIVAN